VRAKEKLGGKAIVFMSLLKKKKTRCKGGPGGDCRIGNIFFVYREAGKGDAADNLAEKKKGRGGGGVVWKRGGKGLRVELSCEKVHSDYRRGKEPKWEEKTCKIASSPSLREALSTLAVAGKKGKGEEKGNWGKKNPKG